MRSTLPRLSLCFAPLAAALLVTTFAAGARAQPSDCLVSLKAQGHGASEEKQPQGGNAACEIEDPVRLESVRLDLARPFARERARVDLPQHPLLSCRFAEIFSRWIAELAAPLTKGETGAALVAVESGPGFECRTRNHDPAAKISAHATGLAIDVAGFRFSDGKRAAVGDAASPYRGLVQTMRAASCGWFTTVLGPGSDAAHATHLHLDAEARGRNGNSRLCE